MKPIPQNLVTVLEQFLTDVNKAHEIHWKNMNFTHNVAPQIRVENVGPKYARLGVFELSEKKNWCVKSVYCFLDITNGNILKGSWKAPVKNGVRGNLNDVDVLDKVTVYGVAYLPVKRNAHTISVLLGKV